MLGAAFALVICCRLCPMASVITKAWLVTVILECLLQALTNRIIAGLLEVGGIKSKFIECRGSRGQGVWVPIGAWCLLAHSADRALPAWQS